MMTRLACLGAEDDLRSSTEASSITTKKRKPHQKSRSGCRTCKRRKIKCDEAEPECAQCRRFGVPCDFLSPSEWDHRTSLSGSDHSLGRKIPRGRPRSDWSQWHKSRPQTSQASSQANPGTASPESSVTVPPALDVDDLLLMHHYSTVTAATLGHVDVWRDSVPKLGQSHPGVLHAILSISAYHLARSDLQNAPKHLTQAERHYEIAVRDATSMVTRLTVDNCQAFYALAVLICFNAFARRPSPGSLMLLARDGDTSSLQLIRGVRLVIETFGSSVVFSGFLATNGTTDHDENEVDTCGEEQIRQRRERRIESAFPGWRWRVSLTQLRDEVPASSALDVDDVLRGTISSIMECFESICETLPPPQGRKDADFVSVMGWVYRLDESFIKALNGKNGTALILVGFFGVCLNVLEGFWWLAGWGKHILRELKDMLGDEYDKWLPCVT